MWRGSVTSLFQHLKCMQLLSITGWATGHLPLLKTSATFEDQALPLMNQKVRRRGGGVKKITCLGEITENYTQLPNQIRELGVTKKTQNDKHFKQSVSAPYMMLRQLHQPNLKKKPIYHIDRRFGVCDIKCGVKRKT